MTGDERENDLIRSVALQNASSILIARQRQEGGTRALQQHGPAPVVLFALQTPGVRVVKGDARALEE